MKKRMTALLLALALAMSMLTGCGAAAESEPAESLPPVSESEPAAEAEPQEDDAEEPDGEPAPDKPFSLADVPEYSGTPFAVIHDNVPYFTAEELTAESFEEYSPLDGLGRCGVAQASVGWDLMPTEKRGDIHNVKPTGWHSVQYDNVDGKSLYNRCHLIGFQLTGENANERNLITGTRYMNVDGMLPFENLVADYVQETNEHVMYRVTPVFEGDNLVADGVLMEGWSVEDEGDGVCFCVFAYNVQPGITLDYATGESRLTEEAAEQAPADSEEHTYILNTNSKKFHEPSCSSADDISAQNRKEYRGTREELLAQGYEPCGRCKP